MKKHIGIICMLALVLGLLVPVRAYAGSEESDASLIRYGTVSAEERSVLEPLFDAAHYVSANPDVVASVGSEKAALFDHFATYGLFEGRELNGDFNVSAYKSSYEDLRKEFGSDILAYYLHYARNGLAEKRALVTIPAAVKAGISVRSAVTGALLPEAVKLEDSLRSQAEPVSAPDVKTEKNGEVVVLFTSDIHCGIDQGFGFAGLKSYRDNLEAQGYTTILVDDGDAIQGEALGTLTKGEAIVKLMNAVGYDAAIPGNHEFDYGMDAFLSLTKKADFPYVSCNFNKEGELIFAPYVIKEAAGLKIAFVGITTPKTLTSSTPGNFMDENGRFVYGFLHDEDGSTLYKAVQKAVDDARAEGADLVYVMAHLGNEAECIPYTYVDVIANTTGIDVFLDGHSHDTDRVVMKNKAGEDVTRQAVGTKLNTIGYSYISKEGKVVNTGASSWTAAESADSMFAFDNDVARLVKEAKDETADLLDKVVATTSVELTIYDPNVKDANGNNVRMVRRAETNLGDLCADAYRDQSGADIAMINGGGVRTSIKAGNITYGDIIKVHPFGNNMCVVEATGQMILDALEWTCRALPGETGGFLQVSGMSYDIDVNVASTVTEDENGLFAGVSGERRVKNVKVGGTPIDPEKKYTVASIDYLLLLDGDGVTSFRGATLLQDRVKIDNQVLIDYIVDTLGGKVGEEYSDPYGQGRITILD